MPCLTWPDDWNRPKRKTQIDTVAEFKAVLCGILTAAKQKAERTGYAEVEALLDEVDWKEAGVKRVHVEKWWEAHQKEDEARRKREAEKREKDRLRQSAIKKLTDEERKALGL